MSYTLNRFSQNRCSSIAAELTVTSLLALVPLTIIVFSLLAFIPNFKEIGDQLQSLMFQYFVPGTDETVQSYINEFVSKARGLSTVGTLMLLVTALLMMRTIDSSFNKIWQVKSNKSLVRTFLVYWAVLTLGPILLGSSLLISSYIESLPFISNSVDTTDFAFAVWLPFVMAVVAFSVMLYVIPNRKILLIHAIYSGLFTAFLFELAKSAFGLFVSSFSTYQVLFGAVAAVPLFLIWIYLSWGIVLLGAEFCHALVAFNQIQQKKHQHPFIEIVSVILLLAHYQKTGKTLSEDELKSISKAGRAETNLEWIEKLINAGVVSKGQDQSYCLIVSADKLEYSMIYTLSGRNVPELETINAADIPKNIKQQLLSLTKNFNQMLNDRLVVSGYPK